MLKDFYTKLSDQEKKIFYVTLGFILLAAFDFLFLQKVSSKLKNLDRDIEQTKNDINRNVRFLAYQEKIFKENEIYGVYQADERKTEEESIAAFLKTIENLGTEAEVTLGKLNPADAVSKKGYMQYYANVECNGKFENIVKFIHKIDTTNNLLKVVKMNIVGKKSSADEVTVSMKISKLIIDAQLSVGAVNFATDASGKISMAGGNPTKSAGGSLGSVASGNKNNLETGQGAGSQGVQGSRSQVAGQASSGNSSGGSGANSKGGSGGDGNGAGGSGASDSGVDGDGGGGSGGGRNGGGGQSGAGGTGTDGNGGGSGGNGGGDQGGASDSGVGGSGDAATDGQDDDGSGGSANASGGSASSAAGSSKGQGGKESLKNKSPEENDSQNRNKKATPLSDVKTGERMKVKNIESLWNDFWGIKPKQTQSMSTKIDPRSLHPEDYKSKDEVNPNVWERVLNKKK